MALQTVLVTGGAGYIGSHTVVQLLESGLHVLVLDNFCNSHRASLTRVEQITGKSVHLIEGDVRDQELLAQLFSQHHVDAVIHFAALKAVGESQSQPLQYYENNVAGSLTLFDAMDKAGVRQLVFSSSATVYGEQGTGYFDEQMPVSPMSVYGRTKLMVEDIVRDLCAADKRWQAVLLRYFNPVGAHPSGLIGEDPNGLPNNLMPFVSQVAIGKRDKLTVFGNDYPTPDGTGLRDYIHVQDLARGHLAALCKLDSGDDPLRTTPRPTWPLTVNLGTGRPYSVLELVAAYQRAAQKTIPYEISDRRPGDVAICYANPSYAEQCLHWHAELDLDAMCADAWRWQLNNPNGFRT